MRLDLRDKIVFKIIDITKKGVFISGEIIGIGKFDDIGITLTMKLETGIKISLGFPIYKLNEIVVENLTEMAEFFPSTSNN